MLQFLFFKAVFENASDWNVGGIEDNKTYLYQRQDKVKELKVEIGHVSFSHLPNLTAHCSCNELL